MFFANIFTVVIQHIWNVVMKNIHIPGKLQDTLWYTYINLTIKHKTLERSLEAVLVHDLHGCKFGHVYSKYLGPYVSPHYLQYQKVGMKKFWPVHRKEHTCYPKILGNSNLWFGSEMYVYTESPVIRSPPTATFPRWHLATPNSKEASCWIHSLKLIASSHLKMDAWNTSFLLGWPIFQGLC